MGEGDGPADELIRFGRVDVQAEAKVDGSIELGGGGFLDEFGSLGDFVDFRSVDLSKSGFIVFADFFHGFAPYLMAMPI